MNIVFHEESFILAEKTQSAGIANSLTGDTLCAISEGTQKHSKFKNKFMGFFSNLLKPKLKHPEDYYNVTITDEFVRVEHPKIKTEQIAWSEIESVKLINTDEGPAAPDIWLTLIGKNSGCMIPQGATGYEEVYEIVSKYENFDFEKVIESMSCTENRDFLLWKK